MHTSPSLFRLSTNNDAKESLSKMGLTGLFSYAVVYSSVLAFAFDITLAQTSIDCSCICSNKPVNLSCTTTKENGVIWDSPDGLFDKIQFHGGSNNTYEGNKKNNNGFNATILKIEDDFLLTTLQFYPNSSYENHIIRCRKPSDNDFKKCTINYIGKCIPFMLKCMTNNNNYNKNTS